MKRVKIIAALAVYVAVLLWAYAEIISPAFTYDGYNLYWPGPLTFAWLFALILAPVSFLPPTLVKPSALIAWWMYMTVYIPSILVPSLSLTLSFSKLLPLQVALLTCMGLLSGVIYCRPLRVPQTTVRSRLFWKVLGTVWVVALVFVCAHFSFSTLLVNLAGLFLGGSEYTIRSGFFDELSQAGRLLGYTTGQIGEALDPFFVAYGLTYGKKKLVLLGFAGQLVIFAVVGSKSILFSTIFMVVIYLLMTRFRRNFGVGLISLLVGVVLLSAAADAKSGGIFLSSITTRRTLIDPGLLTGFYYEYYTETPHVGLGYHFGGAGENAAAPSYEIGRVYFGNEHIDANANLWAEGFADFGVPGIFGFTLILATLMWLYDSVATRNRPEFAVLLITMQAFAFSNSAPLTVAITHGGVAMTALLWFSRTVQPPAEEDLSAEEWPEDFPELEEAGAFHGA